MRRIFFALVGGVIGAIGITEILRHYIFFSSFIGIPIGIAFTVIIYLNA
ncbi:MAG: hypothetical protein ACLFP2_05080 [Candidatus Woesearchaeota archaeon]